MTTTMSSFFDIFSLVPPAEDAKKLEHDNRVQDMPVTPLALVLHWRDALNWADNHKLANLAIYEAMDYEGEGAVPKSYPNVEQKYIDQAEAINRHFRNKFMLTSLRGFTISQFRTAVLDYLENPLKLANKHIKILLRLPDFYQEDLIMQDLVSKYESVDDGVVLLESVITHVATVERVVSRRPHCRYYFKTNENKLLCFQVDNDNSLAPTMKYIVGSKNPVMFRGNVYGHYRAGYPDFKVYMIGSNNYELF